MPGATRLTGAGHMNDSQSFQLYRTSRALNLMVRDSRFKNSRFLYERDVCIYSSHIEGHIEIGYQTYINPQSDIRHCKIGRYCSIANGVTISPSRHPIDWLSTHPSIARKSSVPFRDGQDRMVFIGHDVWIGANATIMAGVSVGHGAIIGNGAIVTKDVPPYHIMVGAPAKPLRLRFSEPMIEALLEVGWWDYRMLDMAQRPDFSDTGAAIDIIKDLIDHGKLARLVPHHQGRTIYGLGNIDFP
jgi:virginiamycin A acetyltransferase